MTNYITNVWNEIRVTDEGISITLFAETREGRATVEDETWFTFDELQSPQSPISLNLSEETVGILSEMQDDILPQELQDLEESLQVSNLPEVGDIVRDGNPPDWSEAARLEVVDLPDMTADEYVVDPRAYREDETVADANPSCDPDEQVVVAQYVEGPERHGSDETYAFPLSRIEEVN